MPARCRPRTAAALILICDVGHCMEVYADFTGQGKNYTQFPDRQSFRIRSRRFAQGRSSQPAEAIWLDPQSLDPTRTAAKATREIAGRLAEVSKALKAKDYPAEEVAQFFDALLVYDVRRQRKAAAGRFVSRFAR